MGQKVKIGFKLLTDSQQIVSIDNIKIYDEGASSVEGNLPITTQLFQNYPNPFNPSTTIKFTLSESASIKVIIFNSNGSEIAVLANENRSAGHHSIDFDGSKFTSGIYFYSLEANGRKIGIKKMVLLK